LRLELFRGQGELQFFDCVEQAPRAALVARLRSFEPGGCHQILLDQLLDSLLLSLDQGFFRFRGAAPAFLIQSVGPAVDPTKAEGFFHRFIVSEVQLPFLS